MRQRNILSLGSTTYCSSSLYLLEGAGTMWWLLKSKHPRTAETAFFFNSLFVFYGFRGVLEVPPQQHRHRWQSPDPQWHSGQPEARPCLLTRQGRPSQEGSPQVRMRLVGITGTRYLPAPRSEICVWTEPLAHGTRDVWRRQRSLLRATKTCHRIKTCHLVSGCCRSCSSSCLCWVSSRKGITTCWP